MEYGDLGF